MQLNIILRNIVIAGIYILPFVPLVVATSMFFPFITGKAFLFRFIIEFIFGAWVILAVRDKAYRPAFSWIMGALAAFLGIIALADLLSGNLLKAFWSNYERMEGFITIAHLVVYFLIAVSVLKAEKLWERFFHISLGVSVFIGMYGILQLAGELVINQGGVRVDGTMGNATYLAAYMLFHAFFSVFWYVRKARAFVFDARPVLASFLIGFGIFMLWGFIRMGNPGLSLGPVGKSLLVFAAFASAGLWFLFAKYKSSLWVGRIFYGLLVLLQVGLLYNTATRGTMFGLIGGTIVMAFLILILERQWTIARKTSLAVLLGIVIVVGGFFAIRDSSFVRESQVLGRFANISLGDAESRFLIWNMSIQGFKEKPILGWGQEGFSLVFNKYYDARMYKQEPWFDRAHNVFFDWLIAGGALGLLAYLSIFGAALYYLLLYRRKENFLPLRERVVLIGLFAAYFVHNVFVFDQLISYIFLFSVLAYIHTQYTREKDVLFSKKEMGSLASADSQVLNHIVISVVVLATPFLIYILNGPGYLANKTLLKTIAPHEEGVQKNLELFKKALSYESFGTTETREQLSQITAQVAGAEAVPSEIKNEFFILARDEMKKQIERVPNDARYHLFLATTYLAYGFGDEALETLEAARLISPKKQAIYFMIANAYLGKGEFEKAFETIRIAYELDTTYGQAETYYIATAIYAGHDDIVNTYLQEHEIPTDSVIINALVSRGQFGILLEIWEKRVAENPNNVQYRVSLAANYIEVGRKAEAIEQIRTAMELDPSFVEQGQQLLNTIGAEL